MKKSKKILALGLCVCLMAAQAVQTVQAAYIQPLETAQQAGVYGVYGTTAEFSQEGPGETGNGTQSQNTQSSVSQSEPGAAQNQTAGQNGAIQEAPGSGVNQGTGTALEPGSAETQTTGSLPSSGTYSTKNQDAAGTQTGSASQAAQEAAAQIAVPAVSAEAAILYDVTHDKVLFEKNADEKLYPASITKLMTALVVLEHASMDETVTFSKSAVTNLESGAVTLGVTEGDQISVKDCMYGLLLKSANEVANGLAEHVAGSVSAFAAMMNEKARALGCTGTNFVNPNGLNDPNHYTTCRDMAKVSAAAFANETICQISSTMSYQFPATKKVNQVRTLTPGHKMLYPTDSRYYEGIVGGKTGYTSLAGNTLVTCTERDGVRLIAVVMKAQSTHYTDTKAILDYGYALNAAGAVGGTGRNHWVQDGTVWHFELADGTRLKNGRYTIDDAEFIFDASGNMLTGWQCINGNWYFMESSGILVKNDWRQDQNKWFYLGSDGAIVKNAVIDGQYVVGEDGAWIQN